MRIHKFLSQAGIASRRKAESMVASKKVKINGEFATIGQAVDPAVDVIEVGGKKIKPPTSNIYYLVHKPHGVVSTVNDPEGRPTVIDLVPKGERLYPVGRLDYDSEGLMILTNDGEFTNKLTHPKYEVDKTYHVLIRGTLAPQNRGRIEHGLRLSDGMTAPATVANIVAEGGNTWLDITIHEGKNREVRRMFEAVGHTVLRLIRTKLGPYELGDLKTGEWRILTPLGSVLK